MATTLTAATMTVSITEALTLNGKNQGGTTITSFASIAEISQRILTITTNEATIATFSGAVASSGHYNDSAVRYMRFTNKDDTNFITLTFRNQDNDEVAIKLDAGNSFIWSADNAGGMVDVFNATQDADAASDTALGNLTNIQADANTGSCDLEMFIASV
tara:strand:- start:24635 stop:25114 length:480 start_codon:yes stop_codon:yes gene_type:complete